MKSGAAPVVPLPDDPVANLAALPRFEGDYVFSVNGGKTSVKAFSKYKDPFDAEML